MIQYVPFLKAKRGELTAMGELGPEVKQAICPLFDFPRKQADYSAETYAATARSIATSLTKHWGIDAELYFDDFDIAQQITVEGEHQYAYVLKALDGLQVIPVVGLGRTTHNAAVARLKRNNEIASDIVAFRVERDAFEYFDEDEIDYYMANVFERFETIDLILDCRLCTSLKVSEAAQQIASFAKKFCDVYDNVRRVIVTGSSIPASIKDVIKVDSTEVVARQELDIFTKARELSVIELTVGDYATVSPFYSDALDPKLMQSVMTPRLIYPFKRSHYLTRGTSMKSGGYEQYVVLTSDLCEKEFFRPGYSAGEEYFYEKSQGHGKNATNGTVVKPSVVAHITYMVLNGVF